MFGFWFFQGAKAVEDRQAADRGGRRGRQLLAVVLALGALMLLPVAIGSAHPMPGTQSAVPGTSAKPAAPGQPVGARFGGPYLNDHGHAMPYGVQPRRDHRPPEAPSVLTDTHWTNLWPELVQVSAVSASEAWAAGEYGHLIHYTNTTWVNVDPPEMHGLDIYDLKMLSSADGWITSGYSAFEYNGANWNYQGYGLHNTYLYEVAPVASDNVWAVGDVYTDHWRSSFVHWDGSTWTATGPVLTDTVYLNNIDMHGPADGWAVGYDYDNGTGTVTPVVFRYNGSSWSRVAAPSTAMYLSSISARVAGEAWIAGDDTSYQSTIFRYAGGSWTAYPLPGGSSVRAITMLDSTHGWATSFDSIQSWDGTSWSTEYTINGEDLNGISSVSGQVWAVAGGDTVFSRTGSGPWTWQRGGPTTYTLNAVTTLSPNEAWAVGDNGTILRYSGSWYTDTWQVVPTSFTSSLWAVQAVSSNEIYAAGDGIAKWDGANWTQVATSNTFLFALAMTGSGEGWAVGYHGAIWHCSGGTWAQVSSPTQANLDTVAMDSPIHGWAGGLTYDGSNVQPVLLEYDGTNWVDRTAILPPGAPVIYAMMMTGPGEGWAAGYDDYTDPSSRSVLRLTGGLWYLDDPIKVVDAAYSLAPEVLGEVWAVGCGAFHYSAGTWAYADTPTNWCQNGVSLVPGRGGWVVGPYGEILKYDPLDDGRKFYDVPPSNAFYTYINYLADHAIISGYADNTFRPGNNTTRGQLSKIICLAEGWTLVNPSNPTFSDVPPDHPFYTYVETAYAHGVISGYSDGTFRPGNNVTRGQLSKITVLAEGWAINTTGGPHFVDVPENNPFYAYIETAYNHTIISGYSDGTFRPGNNATRGQISKIVYLAITQP